MLSKASGLAQADDQDAYQLDAVTEPWMYAGDSERSNRAARPTSPPRRGGAGGSPASSSLLGARFKVQSFGPIANVSCWKPCGASGGSKDHHSLAISEEVTLFRPETRHEESGVRSVDGSRNTRGFLSCILVFASSPQAIQFRCLLRPLLSSLHVEARRATAPPPPPAPLLADTPATCSSLGASAV